MICLAVVLICTCQPSSLTRFDSGSSMATVVGLVGLSMKRMPRTPSAASRLSSASVTLVSTTAMARARGAERGEGVERAAVVGAVGRGRHDHVAGGADALLEQPIVLRMGVARPQRRIRCRRKAAVVDVHVAVAGIGRRLELGRRGAGRIRHRLRAAGAREDAGGGGRHRGRRGALSKVRRAIMGSSRCGAVCCGTRAQYSPKAMPVYRPTRTAARLLRAARFLAEISCC